MKRLIFIFLICIAFFQAQSQEEAVYTQYFVNPFLYNPAVAGLEEEHQLKMNVRAQWTGFPGAPSTYSLSYNGPINQNIGLGAVLFTENIASLTVYKAQLSYAFRYQADALKLSLGLSTAFNHYSVTNTIYQNELYQIGDVTIEDAVGGVSTFDAAMGIFGNYLNYYAGFSSPNLIRSRLDDVPSNSGSSLFRYYQFLLGAKYKLPGNDIIIEPSILLKKTRNVPFQADINLLGRFLNEQLVAGISYRTGVGGALGLLVGTKISNLSIYYSYDISFAEFQQFNNGSHELTIGINFASKKSWQKKEDMNKIKSTELQQQ